MLSKSEFTTSVFTSHGEVSVPGIGKRVLAVAAACIVANVAGAMVALAMGPFINASFGEIMRNPETDGLLVPALLSGYLVIAIALTWLDAKLLPASYRSAMLIGAVLGLAVFFGGHLVISGWSRMPFGSMAVAGALDSIAVIAAAVAVHAITRVRRAAQ